MPSISITGTILCYERAGQGAPVVFVHGGFSDARMVLADPADWEWTWERPTLRLHLV